MSDLPPDPQSLDLKSELELFLALEAPYLLSSVPSEGDDAEVEEALLAALGRRFHVAKRIADVPLAPGVDAGRAAEWSRDTTATLVRGFFERRRIRASLTDDERLTMFRTMLLTRALDDFLKRAFDRKEVAWEGYPSPQKGFRSRGQEAIVGAAIRLRRSPEHGEGDDYRGDYISQLIRDLAAGLLFVPDPLHSILLQYGKKGTPMDGRDLHPGVFGRGVLPSSAPLTIAHQTLAGLAWGFQRRGEDRVCVSFIGDGGASLGEWHETVNLAAAHRLNMVFVIQNNHWALGTHVREQTAAPRFATRGAGYGIPWATVLGNDPDEVAAAVTWAAERARAGGGPALLELITYRRAGHAHHDDDRYRGVPDGGIEGYEYRDEAEAWARLDPIDLYRERLLDRGVLDERGAERLAKRVEEEVAEAGRQAEEAPWPEPSDYRDRVYADRSLPVAAPPADPPTRRMAYDEAVRQALIELMEEDDSVCVLGEDVGGRYGGAFGVTRGLAKRFGEERCLNMPIAESAIVGMAVGSALAGYRPVAEIQFADFLATGFNPLVNNAAKLHWRWGRPVPMVVRLPYGGATGTAGRLLGGGPYHSQCPEMWFLRTPGWKIVAPATPADAKGLMIAAVRDDNPVIYLEAKGLYGFFRTDLREEVPLGVEHEVPLGEAAVRREGDDFTLVTYGAMVWTALEAAERLAEEGVSAEVIDLRTLWPLDEEALARSVEKTGRVLVLHEDTRRGGLGGELAARIVERLFFFLDAPIVRVTAPDTPVPYSPPLELDFLPSAEDVVREARRLVRV